MTTNPWLAEPAVMAPTFVRVTSYGRPVLKGLAGSLWQHTCGIVENVDLLSEYNR